MRANNPDAINPKTPPTQYWVKWKETKTEELSRLEKGVELVLQDIALRSK
jgi:hypothetical protein